MITLLALLGGGLGKLLLVVLGIRWLIGGRSDGVGYGAARLDYTPNIPEHEPSQWQPETTRDDYWRGTEVWERETHARDLPREYGDERY